MVVLEENELIIVCKDFCKAYDCELNIKYWQGDLHVIWMCLKDKMIFHIQKTVSKGYFYGYYDFNGNRDELQTNDIKEITNYLKEDEKVVQLYRDQKIKILLNKE